MLPIIASIVSGLIANGLPKVADAVVDKGVEYVQNKLGVTLKPESEATPEDYAAIKAEANRHEEFMFKTEVEDRSSARSMQVSTQSRFVPFLAFVIVTSFIAVVVSTLLGKTVADSVLAGTLIGYLSAKAEQVISFYFGSSHSSQSKDSMLYNSTPLK